MIHYNITKHVSDAQNVNTQNILDLCTNKVSEWAFYVEFSGKSDIKHISRAKSKKTTFAMLLLAANLKKKRQ